MKVKFSQIFIYRHVNMRNIEGVVWGPQYSPSFIYRGSHAEIVSFTEVLTQACFFLPPTVWYLRFAFLVVWNPGGTHVIIVFRVISDLWWVRNNGAMVAGVGVGAFAIRYAQVRVPIGKFKIMGPFWAQNECTTFYITLFGSELMRSIVYSVCGSVQK